MKKSLILVGWAILFVAGAILEAFALFNDSPGDTFSEIVRGVVFLGPVFIGLFLAGITWFAAHILGKRPDA